MLYKILPTANEVISAFKSNYIIEPSSGSHVHFSVCLHPLSVPKALSVWVCPGKPSNYKHDGNLWFNVVTRVYTRSLCSWVETGREGWRTRETSLWSPGLSEKPCRCLWSYAHGTSQWEPTRDSEEAPQVTEVWFLFKSLGLQRIKASLCLPRPVGGLSLASSHLKPCREEDSEKRFPDLAGNSDICVKLSTDNPEQPSSAILSCLDIG